jgi:putative cardiolipin synthase
MKYVAATALFCYFSLQLVYSNDSLLILDKEKMSMNYKIGLILQAQKSISLSYYAINEDEVGLKYAAAICYKLQQGVKVKIIIEKSRSKITDNLVQLFKDYGVEIMYYNSFRLHKIAKNFSWLHDKLLVVDSAYAVLGGRNLNNKYYPNSETQTELVDFETLIKGNSGAAAHVYIDMLMHSQYANKPRVKKKYIDTACYHRLKEIIEKNIAAYQKKSPENNNQLLQSANAITFVHDRYNRWPKSKTIADTILKTLENAKTSIVIESPYLIPPIRFMKALKHARKRGVNITLISNSPQVSDAKIIAAAYMNDRKKYLKHKINVFEYNGEKMLHDKLFLVDDSVAIVGSYNFDNISYRMNSEVIAKINDAQFGKQLKQLIDKRLKVCFEVKHPKDKNPYNQKKINCKTKWNRILLRIFPFIRRFL